jgi:hypothetical protein
VSEIPEEAYAAAARSILIVAEKFLSDEIVAVGYTKAARAAAEAAAPHILAGFSERTAGMAEALKNAEAIIGERDRQLAEARAQERERIARHLDALAANYPEDVFPPGAESRDGISGTAMRHAYRNAARSVREDLSEGDGNG